MESRKYSRDRRRQSGNLRSDAVSDGHFHHQDLEEEASDNNSQSNTDQRSRYQRVTNTTSRHVNLPGPDQNRGFSNACSSESDEVSVVEQIRGDPTDPEERSDENTSNRFNIKSPLKETDQVLDKQEKRKKSRRRRWRKEYNCTPTTGPDNEENSDEDRRTVIMTKQRQLSSSSKNESGGDNYQRSKRKKNIKTKADGEATEELPITEILRKAQENSRMQYEEPVALSQLTTDTIYIQGKNGFSAFKIPDKKRTQQGHRNPEILSTTSPIKIAIFSQKTWKNAGLICQGLLAGIALMHFICIQTVFQLSLETLADYSLVSEIYTNLFSFLIAMSIVSALDKYDLGHLNFKHFKKIYDSHAKSIFAVPLYIAVFFLHQINLEVDDKISLLNYERNYTYLINGTEMRNITRRDFESWKTMTLSKDGISVLAWIFISLGPEKDMLLSHLQSLEKYIDSA